MWKVRKKALASFMCLYLDDRLLLVPFIKTRIKKKKKGRSLEKRVMRSY